MVVVVVVILVVVVVLVVVVALACIPEGFRDKASTWTPPAVECRKGS